LLPGWQILLAKDAAFFLIALVLTLPLVPLAALSAALALSATGHIPSVVTRRPLARWRFSVGAPILTNGILQLVATSMAAAGTEYGGPFVIGLAAAAYVASLYTAGKYFERNTAL